MSDELSRISERDFLKGIAADIAKQVCHHIKVMYPQAVEATPSTFLLSVKGCVINEIMAALDFEGGSAEMSRRIAFRESFRRHIEAIYRGLRKPTKGRGLAP